jgi:molecular chaperone GrpE
MVEQENTKNEKSDWDVDQWEIAYNEQKEKTTINMAGWQRAQADYQNYKKRIDQERVEQSRFAVAPILLNCLDIIDDLERAFVALPDSLIQLTWVNGIALIHRKMQSILESNGVKEIESEGKHFDPNLHEAISQVPGEDGQIMTVIQKGYQLHDRVLRPTLVQVGNGEAADKNEEPTTIEEESN